MSSYYEETIHPKTRKLQRAFWIDDYFGRHQYGVRFDGEETVYRLRDLPRFSDMSKTQPAD